MILEYPDESTVRVVGHGEEATSPAFRPNRVERPVEDDGARLDTPESRRRSSVADMTRELEMGVRQIEKAISWARSINYHPDVLAKLEEARRAADGARDLIEVHE